MRFAVVTEASPDQVRRALTDFSDRRPRIWSRTLDARRYELRDQGETWAIARESSPGSPFWVVARYDWSDPDAVRWIVVESSYGGGGGGEVRIHRSGGGSRLDIEWRNTDPRPLQVPLLWLLHRRPMGWMIARMWTSALDTYARSEPA